MADLTPTPSDESGQRRPPVPGWVWILLVVVAVGGSLLAGWWFGRDTTTSEAPGRPEAFCNAVGELQGSGDMTLDVGTGAEGTKGLSDAAAGLRRLAAAEPPARIRDDLEQLAGALDEVVVEAESVAPDDPTGLDRVLTVLDDRLRGSQAASDRVNAYTDRWCGAALNSPPTTG
jgi:hypothetical protein